MEACLGTCSQSFLPHLIIHPVPSHIKDGSVGSHKTTLVSPRTPTLTRHGLGHEEALWPIGHVDRKGSTGRATSIPACMEPGATGHRRVVRRQR